MPSPAGIPAPQVVAEAAPQEASPILVVGAPVEREIGGDASHVYRLPLEAGSFVRLRIAQPGIDIIATLEGPDGTALTTVDDSVGSWPERIVAVTTAAGEHRLRITPRSPEAHPGVYKVELKELRPSEPGDARRLEAEAAFAEGLKLQVQEEETLTRQSLSMFQSALAGWRELGDREGEVRALVEIGATYLSLSEAGKTIQWCNQALKLAEALGDIEGQAEALNNLGDATRKRDEALEIHGKSLVLWQKLGSQHGIGKTLYALGLWHLQKPDYSKSEPLLREALKIQQALRDTPGEAATLVSLQDIHFQRSEIDKSYELLERALDVSIKAGYLRGRAGATFSLGRNYRLSGELQRALDSFNESMTLNKRIGERRYVRQILNALGSMYLDLGDFESARGKYEEALEVDQELQGKGENSMKPGLLNNLGWTTYRQGDTEGALSYYQKALQSAREQRAQATESAVLHNIGVSYIVLGRFHEGLNFLQESLELRKDEGPSARANTLREIAIAYQKLGNPQQAADYFQRSCELSKEIEGVNLSAECLFRWATLDREQGRLAEALRKIQEAISIVESVRSQVEAEKLRTSFFASKRAYYELYIELLMSLHHQHPDTGYQAKALAASEQARTRTLFDLIAKGRIDVGSGVDVGLRQKETVLNAQLSLALSELKVKGAAAAGGTEGLLERLTELEGKREDLASEIRDRYPEYAQVRYPKPLDLEGVRKLLDDRTALLEYFVGESSSFLFVVTQGEVTSYLLPPPSELAQRVKNLRELLGKPSVLEISQFRRQAFALYKDLVGPAAKVLAGKDLLLIAPDGPLYVLPFEVLLSRGSVQGYADLPYLIRDHAIAYVPSASVLEGLRKIDSEDTGPTKDFVAFAPVYGDVSPQEVTRSRRGLAPLPYSKLEVESIADLYPPDAVAIYLQEQATEANVKGNPLVAGARYLYFAAHGSVNEEQPELSGLALADGDLQVHEIFGLKLKADLVVLSACETGLGKQVAGEGMVGLTRAFLYAGAKSLVVSLWPVVDRSASQTMSKFSKSFRSLEGKAESLRDAKLDMIKSGRPEPYYWAPFILAGDAR